MIDIILDCSKELQSLLKEYINSLCIANFITYQSISSDFILIKEFNHEADIDIVKNLNQLKYCYHLVCLVSNEQFIFDLLDLHRPYFVRERSIEKDKHMIEDCINDFKSSKSSFVELITNYEHIVINIHTIIYIESFYHEIIVHTTNGDFKSRKRLSEMFELVKYFGFIQIHKSYVINKKYISVVFTKEIELNKSIKLPIGRKYKVNTQNL